MDTCTSLNIELISPVNGESALQHNFYIGDPVEVTIYFTSMDVKGCKPGQPSRVALDCSMIPGGGVGFGERLSICGQFAISKQGAWRALEPSQQIATEPVMEGMDTTGKHLSVWPIGLLAGIYHQKVLEVALKTTNCEAVHPVISHCVFMQTAGQLRGQVTLSKTKSAQSEAASTFRQHGTFHLK